MSATAPFTVIAVTSALVVLGSPSTGLPSDRPDPDMVVDDTAAPYTESAPPAEGTPARTESSNVSIAVMDALRARLTGGAVFFNQSKLVHNEADGTARYESPQFSMASTYVALEAQPRLWPMADPAILESHRRGYVEAITNVRLTTIGVAENGGSAVIGGPDASVLNSEKSAQLEFGVLASINARRFNVGGTWFHWGFGAVYRTALQTVTDAQRNRRVWNTEDDIYSAHMVGVRATLYSRAESSPKKSSWTPTAYMDFAIGRFENFERVRGGNDAARECLLNAGACLAAGVPTMAEFAVEDEARLQIEGRMFIRSLYLGFSLNTGRGADDVRFIAGATLDLSRFFQGVAEQNGG